LIHFDKLANEIEVALHQHSLTIALITLTVAFIFRLVFASMAQYPGHGDYAFYYTVAENIADGKGFQTDYIWVQLLLSPEGFQVSP